MRAMLAVVAGVSMSMAIVLGSDVRALVRARQSKTASQPTASQPMASQPAASVELRELLEPGAELTPSRRALALDRQRVRLVGFMAEMELPPRGAIYLVPQPLRCDEAGGGTADLPPESVLVLADAARDQPVAHVRGPVEAIGIFEVGNHTDEQGRTSNFRLRLDEAPAPSRTR